MAMAMVVAVAARTLVRIDDGDRGGDDALASSPVPRLPAPWRQWRRSKRCSAMTTATGRAMMPRHHHLSVARLRDGDGSGSGVRSCPLTAVTGQTMMPWHHHLSLARPRDGNCDGGGRGGARQRLVCKLIDINPKKTINAFIILIFIHQLTQHKPTVHRAPSCIWWSQS
jgi:hypothetical protein